MLYSEEAAKKSRQKAKEHRRNRKALLKKHCTATQTEEPPFDWLPYLGIGGLLCLALLGLGWRNYDRIKKYIFGEICSKSEPCKPCMNVADLPCIPVLPPCPGDERPPCPPHPCPPLCPPSSASGTVGVEELVKEQSSGEAAIAGGSLKSKTCNPLAPEPPARPLPPLCPPEPPECPPPPPCPPEPPVCPPPPCSSPREPDPPPPPPKVCYPRKRNPLDPFKSKWKD